jgi:hypothetical protein
MPTGEGCQWQLQHTTIRATGTATHDCSQTEDSGAQTDCSDRA